MKPKLVVIIGPHAVGKMTVGHELEKITGLKLFHNHMTIELVAPFFSYGSLSGKKLVNLFRREMFKEVANSDLEGIIFTYVCFFDNLDDWNYIEDLAKIFDDAFCEVYFVELEAGLDARLLRNRHEFRLSQKPTKRDVVKSEKSLLESVANHRLNSFDGEIKRPNYLRINNSNLAPEVVAKMIKERFEL